MTVCIGALADSGKTVIAIADKMISINSPMAYQYENEEVQKIFEVKDNVVVMYAGATNLADEIIKNSIIRIRESKPDTVEATANLVKDAYQAYRLNFISEAVLTPHQLTIEEYKEKQQTLNQEVVNSIEKALTEFNLQIELIVCGIDKTGGHIYTISNPGINMLSDGVGYACIGIGAPHALYSLIDSNYTKSINKTDVEKMLEDAKKRSENAPGVGKLTDKRILTSKEDKGG